MADPALLIALASSGTLAIAMTAAAALRGWQDWLEVRRLETERRRPGARGSTAARFEIADLRERIRRLEAIANGSGEG